MKIKLITLTFLVLFLPLSHAFTAEEVKVSTIFDKRSVEVNGELNLTIKVIGSRVNIQRPHIPVNESFDSYYSGRASRFVFANGQQESVTEFRFTLIPKQAGTFKVGPIEIDVNDATYRTDPVDIEVISPAGVAAQTQPVLPARKPSPIPQGPSSSGFQPLAPSRPSTGVPTPALMPGEDDIIFLRVWADKTNIFPGEQILLTYSLYTRADTRYEGFEEEPQATGFWIEEIPIGQNVERSMTTVGGRDYIKADIRKMALFATSPGEFPIQPGSIKVAVEERQEPSSMFDEFFSDSFFGGGGLFARRVNKVLTSNPIVIQVRQLPTRGKPSEFSGTVGRFNFTSSVDKKEVKQNEPVTLKLKIEGEGNIETLQHPPVPDLENFKVYEGESASNLLKRGNTIVGSKEFEIIFIPEKVGTFGLPSLLFNYFDPVAQEYKVIRTPEYPVKVLPGEPSEELKLLPHQKSEELKKVLEKEESDIYTIKTDLRLSGGLTREVQVKHILGGVNGALGLGFLFFFLAKVRSKAYERDRARYLAKSASKSARRKYRRLLNQAKRQGEKATRELYVEAAKIMDQYFSHKFGFSMQGLTFADIENKLAQFELGEETFEDVRGFYETADLARFTTQLPPHERLIEMLVKIEAIILEIEKKR